MNSMKLSRLLSIAALVLIAQAAHAVSSPWEQPAAALAEQIASILGPAQARLIIRNTSTISMDEIPAIRRLLEQDLKTRGVQASGTESANIIRVTLSENLRERLWVAEIVEGNQTRVAMVRVDAGAPQQVQPSSGLTLRRQSLFTTTEPILAALEVAACYVIVEPEEIVILQRSGDGWREQKRVGIGQKKPLARDPRAVIAPASNGEGFETRVAGSACSGRYENAALPAEWTIHCHESDDPWPVAQLAAREAGSALDGNVSATPIRAFFNAGRNYFTGVVTPNLGADLPPFYTAALLPRPDGAGLLINGIDGKVQLVETTTIKPMAGTRDWGSDFAALNSNCGAGTQIVSAGSGQAINDSVRAYELPALEAIPVSAPLAMDGTVTALWSDPDGKSVFAVVRKAATQGHADSYEVDRVTAICN